MKTDICFTLDQSTSNVDYYNSTGCSLLNLVISGKLEGGLPSGRIVEIFSEESVGKTSIAAHLITQVQKAGGIGMYFDTEHAFDQERALQLGIDKSRYLYFDPTHLQQTLEAMETAIPAIHEQYPDLPVMIVWDSVAATPADVELKGGFEDSHMAVHARALSQGLRKIAPLIAKSKTTLVCINQAKESIGGYGHQYATLGGKAIKFHSSVRLELRKGSPIVSGDKTIGHWIKVKTVKNRIFTPLLKSEVAFVYTEGLSEMWTVLGMLEQRGVVKQSGGWYKMNPEGKEITFRWNQWPDMYKKPEIQTFIQEFLKCYDPLVVIK